MPKFTGTLILGSLIVMGQSFGAEEIGSLADTSSRLAAINGTIQSVNEELSSQRAKIGELTSELELSNDEYRRFRSDMLEELKALRRQNQSIIDSLFWGGGDTMSTVNGVRPLRNYEQKTPDGKMYFGENEFVYVREANALIEARIDTGAAISSISAKNITMFERNGKKWYRFNIEANDRMILVEAPFVRFSEIRQSAAESTIKRVVVSLNVKIGEYSGAAEFTLIDRSLMQFALLIGRNLIQDIAVVDVSRSNIQGTRASSPDVQVILMRSAYETARKNGINPNEDYDRKIESKAGMIASPASRNVLSTDPKEALPAVVQKKKEASADAASGES